MPDKKSNEMGIAVIDNINTFILSKMLSGSFPEVNGFATGIPFEDGEEIMSRRDAEPMTAEEIHKKLVFHLFLAKEISQERKKKILLVIAEQFFRFTVMGEAVLQSSLRNASPQ